MTHVHPTTDGVDGVTAKHADNETTHRHRPAMTMTNYFKKVDIKQRDQPKKSVIVLARTVAEF